MSEQPRDRFDQELRRWAEQPPRTPPAAAARQVLSRLDRPRRATRRPVLALALTLATVLTLALGFGWWARQATAPAEPPTAGVAAVTATAIGEATLPPPLSDDVVLLWLDPETPLYLSLQPSKTDPGDPT